MLSHKTLKGGTQLYPSDPESKAKIDELLEELKAVDFRFIALTRIFGVPEQLGAGMAILVVIIDFGGLF